jgi:hypothetical protein
MAGVFACRTPRPDTFTRPTLPPASRFSPCGPAVVVRFEPGELVYEPGKPLALPNALTNARPRQRDDGGKP